MKTFDFSTQRTGDFAREASGKRTRINAGASGDRIRLTNEQRSLSGCWPFCWLAMLVAFAADAGRLLVVDDPQPSDVILVLAGETDRRPARALELLDQGYGRRVVIDVPAAARIYDSTQVQLAEKYVQGLPAGGIGPDLSH